MLDKIKKFFGIKDKDEMYAVIHLHSGIRIETTISGDRRFDPSGFSKKTVWRFPSRNRRCAYLLSGKGISLIEVVQ